MHPFTVHDAHRCLCAAQHQIRRWEARRGVGTGKDIYEEKGQLKSSRKNAIFASSNFALQYHPISEAIETRETREPMKTNTKVGFILILCYLVAWLDRMAINMTIQDMAKDLSIGPEYIGWVLSSFFAGYALFQIPGGLLADRIGARLVILIALAWWSIFTGLTGVASTFGMMLLVRFFFGIGEGVFPASVWKLIGTWFTKKNRATANALVISSIALGPALTPLLLAPILAQYGWRACFYVLGCLGIVTWGICYKMVFNSIYEHPQSTLEEQAEFEADLKSEAANQEASLQKANFSDLLKTPIIWVLFSIGLVTNIAMYGWLNWLPSYLLKAKGLDLKSMAFAASIPFMFGAIGCMAAGYVSDQFFRGRRKVLVLICMITGMISLYFFTQINDMTTFMIMQCIAGFSLFMASGALWALPMIFLPPNLMGSGSGFINTGGQIGGFLSNILIGYYIHFRGDNYAAGFDVMLGALFFAIIIVFLGVHEAKTTDQVQTA